MRGEEKRNKIGKLCSAMEATEKFVKAKSENPYRYGVLIGNHTEDRFGSELKEQLVPRQFAIGVSQRGL